MSHIVQCIPGSRGLGEWIVSGAICTEVSHYQPVFIRCRGHSSFLQPSTSVPRDKRYERNPQIFYCRIVTRSWNSGISRSSAGVLTKKINMQAKTNALIDSQATEQ